MKELSLADRKRILRERDARFHAFQAPGPLTPLLDAQAKELLEGKLRFSIGVEGAEPIVFRIGRRNIDWSGGHLNHQEWPTQMNRFFLLNPLMAAFRATGDGAFAEAARDYVEDWMDRFDPEDLERRGNTCMDIGIRLGTGGFNGWAAALPLFLDHPSWDDAFVERMLASMERQARILWQRGIPSRPWGNHRIFGLDGLLHYGLRQPFAADADAMLRFARAGLRDALQRQFHDDGSHIEQTLGYHRHMAGTFLHLQRLDAAFPEAGLKLDVRKLLGAVDYMLHTLPAGVNDTPAEKEDREHGAEWEEARRWRDQLTGRPEPGWAPPKDALFADAGQVFLRSAWAPGSDFLAFDAGPYSGSHAHQARLGLVFRSGGRLWLADPGMFDYEMSNPFALYGRSTAAHNTLNIGGLNQGATDARLLKAEWTDGHALLHGAYDGSYWTGEYRWGFQNGCGQGTFGRHERIVLWIRGEYMVILDLMASDLGLPVETVWQLAPVAGWRQDPEALAWESTGPGLNFHLRMLLPPAKAVMTVHEGEKAPLRGWFCETYAKVFTPAPQVVYRYPADAAFHATLAMPLPPGVRPPEARERPFGSGRRLEFLWPDGRRDLLFLSSCLALALEEREGLATDSPLAWIRLDPEGKPLRQVRLGGNYLEYTGE